MTINRRFTLTLLALAASSLVACSSSSDSDDPDDMDNEQEMTPPGSEMPDGGEMPGEEEMTPASREGVDLTDPLPRFAISECDALAVAEVTPGLTPATAVALLEGQLATATADDETHYYQLELQPGFHFLVADTREATGRDINIGLEIVDIGAPEGSPGTLIDGNETGLRTRLSTFFENPVARTVTLAVTPNFLSEEYVLGVFANGRPIPSPRFTDCPTITTLALDTTQVAAFPERGTEDDLVWYAIDLEAGTYSLDATATRTGGTGDIVGVEVIAFEEYAQADAAQQVIDAQATTGGAVSDAGSFTIDEPGRVWLLLESANDNTTVEFTVEASEED